MIGGGGKKVGTGYVPIKPDTDGFGNELRSGIEGEGVPAASQAGRQMSQAMRGAFLGGIALMGKSVFEFADFDTGMREVFTLMPDISAEAMSEMEGQVKDFSAEFGVLPNETIPALYSSISAGVPADNVFAFLETAQQLAKGGVTELETAVDGLSSVVNAYGADVLSAQEASDLMFTAVKGGKTTVDELAQSLFQVIPTAASTGVEFGNVTAALATMTSAGTPTTVATTQLRQMFVELSKAGSTTAGVFEDVAGKSFKDFIAEGGNVQDALQLLESHAAESDMSISDLFGSVEAGNAALSLTGANAEKFGNELLAAGDSAGATETAFNTMNEGMSASMDRMKARLSVAFINLGDQLAPSVEGIVNAFAGLLDIFAAMPGPMQTVIILGGTITAGIIGFAGPILKAVKVFGMLGKSMSVLAGNPWILAAIALGTIAYLVITNWEEVSAFFVEFGEGLDEVWDSVYASTIGFAVSVYDTVVGKLDELADFFVTYWPYILGIFTGGLGLIVGLVIQNWDTIWSKTVAIYDAVTGKIGAAWDTAYAKTTAVGGAIVSFITGIPGKISGAFSTLAETIASPFRSAFGGIKTAWNSTVGGFGFNVPGWIPGVGGKAFRIPSMAAGGILTDPTMFLGGEYPGAGRDPEIVTPQSMMADTMANVLAEAGNTGPKLVVEGPLVQVAGNITDGDYLEQHALTITRAVQRILDDYRAGAGLPAKGIG